MNKKLVFVTNLLSHYQLPLIKKFSDMYGDDFSFIAETPFNKEMLNYGMPDLNQLPFVLRAYEDHESSHKAHDIINNSECVIFGGIPVHYVKDRLAQGKLTFCYSERFFKGPLLKDIVRYAKYTLYSGGRLQARDKASKFFLLCSGGFAAWDYNTCGLFRDKAYRWGYFPEVRHYDFDELLSLKEPNSILWAGRLINWKHPELAVKLAENLRAINLNFHIKIAGGGAMYDTLENMIKSKNLSQFVELLGTMNNDQIRAEMEKSQIFLFTSDRGEGWGAVLNKAMNSGCAVVAGENIGAVPYLINNRKNGLIFSDQDPNDLTRKVSTLLKTPERIPELGLNAYGTICQTWNADIAAKRFISLAEVLSCNDSPAAIWEDGPCSVAPVI